MTVVVDYASAVTPPDYFCNECGAVGVRLYRPYNTMLDDVTLRCTSCARSNQSETDYDPKRPHSIGWLVAAVPTAENDTFWGYTSVPEPGVEWWDRLPIQKI
jgi:hypothetical protein